MNNQPKQDVDSFITRAPPGKPTTVGGLAITPERMTNELAAELVQELDLGDWELTDWQAEFVESNLSRTHFSLKQKQVIYDMSRKLKLI